MRVKSSSPRSTPAACAIASRCRTALVEPPSAIVTVMAFSNASRVRMSRGLMPLLDERHQRPAGAPAVVVLAATPLPGRSCWAGQAQGLDGARHRVGGVHAAAGAGPRDGGALDLQKFASLTLPAAWPPTASNTDTMSRRLAPGGWCRRRRRSRAVHARHRHDAAGHVLVAAADREYAVEAFGATTVSIESAITSRETSE